MPIPESHIFSELIPIIVKIYKNVFTIIKNGLSYFAFCIVMKRYIMLTTIRIYRFNKSIVSVIPEAEAEA